MIVLLERGASREEVERVLTRMHALGLAGTPLEVGALRLVHVTRGRTRRARHLLAEPGVRAIVPTSGPRVRREGRRFYPFHALCSTAMGLVLLGVLVWLAGFFPPGVSAAVAAGEAVPTPHWPWYLTPMRGVLALAPDRPVWLGPSILVGLFLLLLCLPLLERSRGESWRARAPVLAAGLVVLVVLFGLGVLGART